MIQVDIDDIIAINKSFNKTNTFWVDNGLLESAFSAYYYYATSLEQICSIFRGVVKNHAFSDGNKRTAAAILISFLEQNGYSLLSEDLCNITLDVAQNNYDVSEIVDKLEPLLIKEEL